MNSNRILFTLNRKGNIKEEHSSNYEESMNQLSKAIQIMEKDGAAPILTDGKTGGNVACLIHVTSSEDYLLVSKSGKFSKAPLLPEDICLIQSFNTQQWSCSYYSSNEEVKPTSDTPLYWACFIIAPKKFHWNDKPGFAMHGHSLQSNNDNELLFPCSEKETRFSSRDDFDEMLKLLEKYSYPEYKVFIRKNHGFFIIGKDVEEVFDIYENQVRNKLTKIVTNE